MRNMLILLHITVKYTCLSVLTGKKTNSQQKIFINLLKCYEN